MTQQINKKSFILVVKNSKTYKLIVSGFSETLEWFLSIIQSVVIVAISKLKLSSTATVSLDPVRLEIETPLLSSRALASVTNRISLTPVTELIKRALASVSVTVVLDAVIGLQGRIAASLGISNVIIMIMTTALFNTLGDFDPDTLAIMDAKTLLVLDYTIVT